MKLGEGHSPDSTDLLIIGILQEHGRTPHVKLAEQVGLSAPAVIDRVKKLEDSGIITGYHASVDAGKLGRDITAFIGVSISHPKTIAVFEPAVELLEDVLECHHVTGEHAFLLKVKTRNTSSLERLISSIRSIDGVARTETMVVLSTHTERSTIAVKPAAQKALHEIADGRRHRHGVPKEGSARAQGG